MYDLTERKFDISVIVLNWNGKDLLKNCLKSLEKQVYDPFEIVVVDNGSTDGSANFVKKRFPKCKIVELDENRGFTGGNNAGIRVASGEYIALLNNDVEVDPKWLGELISGLYRHPDCGFATSKILHFDRRDLIDTAGDCLTIAATLFKRGYLDLDYDKYNQEIKVFSACAASCMYRRSMLKETGLFDSDFFNTFEDMDLSFRAQLLGYKCIYIPTSIVYHMVTATITKGSAFHVFYSQRNIEFVMIKNVPFAILILILPLRIVYEFLACLYFFKIGQLRTFVSAKANTLRYLSLMINKRRKIQRKRKVSSGYILRQMQCNTWLKQMWNKFWCQ